MGLADTRHLVQNGSVCQHSLAQLHPIVPAPAQNHVVDRCERETLMVEVAVKHGAAPPQSSPQGNISVTSESWANSGSNWSMMACGSGHSVVSVMTPNCTAPP